MTLLSVINKELRVPAAGRRSPPARLCVRRGGGELKEQRGAEAEGIRDAAKPHVSKKAGAFMPASVGPTLNIPHLRKGGSGFAEKYVLPSLSC